MLTKEQHMEAYRQLTASFSPIWDWKYDEHLRVISSSCNHESLFHQLMMECEIEKAITKHRAQSDLPFIYICDSTLCWIVAFEKDRAPSTSKGHFLTPSRPRKPTMVSFWGTTFPRRRKKC